MTITTLQEKKLKRFSERVRQLRNRGNWQYRVRAACLPSWRGMPGMLSLTADSPATFERLQRMLQRIEPEVQLRNFEHGRGWHADNSSPYYYAEFLYTVKE